MPFARAFSPHRIAAVTRHELRVLFYSLLTYLFQAGFLLVLGLCIFQVGDFYATDESSMRLWVVFMPWTGLVFMPALAMYAWPDGHADRTVELNLTLPVTAMELVCGKYLAGIAVLLVTLGFGLGFPVTLAYLGDPDWGKVAATLLASFLLLALYWAVAICIACMAGDAISAFVIGLVVLFLLALLGASELESLLEAALPGGVAQAVYMLGPRPYFESIASGLVQFSDVSYFLLAIALLLVFCSAAVDARRCGRWTDAFNRKRWLGSAALLAVAVLLQAMAKTVPLEADLTEQGEFTLGDATIEKILQAPEKIQIDFFWSERQAGIPASIRAHANRVRSLLERIEHHSAGNVVVNQFDPPPDTDLELAAITAGVQAVPMTSGDYFYLGLRMQHGGRAHVLAYLDKQRESFLEYDLITAVGTLVNPRVPRIALLSPLLPPTALENPRPGLAFVEELKLRYDVVLAPFFAGQLPEADVLIVLQGAVLKHKMLYAIDQHIMRGGALIAMLDPALRSDKAGDEIRFQPSTELNDLSDLLLSYGVRYAGDSIVGDARLASPVSLGVGEARLSHPYWLRFDKDTMGAEHPVTGGLNDVLLVEAGALEITNGHVARPLLTTTGDAGSYPRDAYRNTDAYTLAADFAIEGGARIVAVLLEGGLRSAFAESEYAAANPEHLDAARRSRVFVVADSDWLFDPFALHTTELGGKTITRPRNDNLAMLENMIAYGAGSDVESIPTRGRLSRPFTRVARLFQNVEREVRANERSTLENVAALENSLAEIRRVSGVESLAELPPPLDEQAVSLQEQLVAMRMDLRNIRLHIRERVDRLGKILAVLNIAGGPLLVLVFGSAVMFLRRNKLSRGETRATRPSA